MNSYEMEFAVKERQLKIADDFQGIHLMKLFRANKSPRRKKWVLSLADLMIDWGTTLKACYRTGCCSQDCSGR